MLMIKTIHLQGKFTILILVFFYLLFYLNIFDHLFFFKGLKYTFNQFGTGCEVNKIDIYADGIDATSSGLDIKLKNPSDFFSFDPDTFHFTGFVSIRVLYQDCIKL